MELGVGEWSAQRSGTVETNSILLIVGVIGDCRRRIIAIETISDGLIEERVGSLRRYRG